MESLNKKANKHKCLSAINLNLTRPKGLELYPPAADLNCLRHPIWLSHPIGSGLRIDSPECTDDKSIEDKNLQPIQNTAYTPAYKETSDDLEMIVNAWQSLPEHIKAAIKALIQTNMEKK